MDAIKPLRGRVLIPIGDISEESRAYLTIRMRNHGNQATDLLNAVVLLDYKITKRISRKLAKPESISSVDQPHEEKLHQEFPETFFDLEASLRTQALRLYAEATLGKPDMVLREYSALMGRCVECHSLFTKRSEKNLGTMNPAY